MNTPDTRSSTELQRLLADVSQNKAAASEELSRFLLPGLRALIRRRVNFQDVDDVVQNTMADILIALKRGLLLDAEALPLFARTIAIRKCAACIKALVNKRVRFSASAEDITTAASWEADPEQTAIKSQRMQVAAKVLSQLSPRDREILRRFYLEEQSQEQICGAMGLSTTQFRLLKSRAKAKCGDMGRLGAHHQIRRYGPSSSYLPKCA